MTTGTSPSLNTAVVLVSIVAITAVLYFGKAVLVPIALALMLAFLLVPVATRLERLGLGRPLAVAMTTLVAFVAMGALVVTVTNQFLGLAERLPAYRDNILAKVEFIAGGQQVAGFERSLEAVKELSEDVQDSAPGDSAASDIPKVQVVEPPLGSANLLRAVFGPLMGPLATGAIVLVFVIFLLLQREDLRDRLVRLLGAREMHTTVKALDDAAQRVSRYLFVQTLINAGQGAIVTLGLYLIGLPDALLWGALTIVLRFIPYLGPVLAAAGPIILSLAVFPDWTHPLMVAGLIVTLELINNNYVEPRLYGASVGVSSFALIVATVFWTWLWGVAGLFLATPLTVCLVVVGKYIPHLQFLSVLLGDEPVLEPRERLYQRLLADDLDEAQEILDQALQKSSPEVVLDTIMLPALRFTEQDHDRGAIDATRRAELIANFARIVDTLPIAPATKPAVPGAAAGPRQQMSVLCLPANDGADELAAQLIARVLPGELFATDVLGTATLKGEMLEHVSRTDPNVVLLSATPPATLVHALYICKRLRGRFGRLPIVVCLWDAQGDLQKATARLAPAGASHVVSSAAEAADECVRLRQLWLQGVVDPAVVHANGGEEPASVREIWE